MLNKCADFCVGLLEKHYSIADDDRPVYVYGFELLFSTLFSLTTVTVISCILGHAAYALFFILFFFSLRLFCGGYHASTYLKCFIITNLTFLSTVAYTEIILRLNLKLIMPFLFFFAAVVIWIFSPVKNENHPCSEKTYRKNKIISRALAAVYLAVYICLFFFADSEHIIVNSAWSFISVSIMIIIEKFKQRRAECAIDSSLHKKKGGKK
ncbi:MAG: accessory gene regulator ArgB-like protein [Acutalibacteraceae bacterium]